MVFIYIPPKASSNLTTTPPNNLTEISTTTEPLPEAILATLATASPLKSTSPEPTIMPEKFTPEFLTQEFCDYLANDLYKAAEEYADSSGFSLVYKIPSRYIGIPVTQLVARATSFCKIPPLPQIPNGTNIEPELGFDDEVGKPCTALQVIKSALSNFT